MAFDKLVCPFLESYRKGHRRLESVLGPPMSGNLHMELEKSLFKKTAISKVPFYPLQSVSMTMIVIRVVAAAQTLRGAAKRAEHPPQVLGLQHRKGKAIVYVYVYVPICIHTYIHTYTCVYVYMCMYVDRYMYVCIYVYMYFVASRAQARSWASVEDAPLSVSAR